MLIFGLKLFYFDVESFLCLFELNDLFGRRCPVKFGTVAWRRLGQPFFNSFHSINEVANFVFEFIWFIFGR